jgi:hypothetical protein
MEKRRKRKEICKNVLKKLQGDDFQFWPNQEGLNRICSEIKFDMAKYVIEIDTEESQIIRHLLYLSFIHALDAYSERDNLDVSPESIQNRAIKNVIFNIILVMINIEKGEVEEKDSMSISTNEVLIKTVSVDIKVITLDKKKMTLSVFRQLEKDVLLNDDGTLHGKPWGRVNYYWGNCEEDHLHIVWQDGEDLKRSCVFPFSYLEVYRGSLCELEYKIREYSEERRKGFYGSGVSHEMREKYKNFDELSLEKKHLLIDEEIIETKKEYHLLIRNQDELAEIYTRQYRKLVNMDQLFIAI